MPPLLSLRQKDHYERILTAYDSHYYDKWSIRYRDEFIFGPMWDRFDLNNKFIADLAPSACVNYRRNTGFAARECDLTMPMELVAEFDAAMVVGGLHHCVADLGQT